MTKPERDYLTTGQAGRILRVSAKTINRWAQAGRIPATRTFGGHYRFDRKEIERIATDAQRARPMKPVETGTLK